MIIKFLLILSISLTAILNSVCYAQTYKYKDKQGNWQYSDKPPKSENTKVYIIGEKNDLPKKKQTTPDNDYHKTDIQASLYKKYNSGNAIERASLATITIKTHLGIGSGFFISNDGYILTNKHVVRPSTSGSWQETNNKFNEQKIKFKQNQKKLDKEEDLLKAMYAELIKREQEIEIERKKDQERQRQRDYTKSPVEYLTARYENLKAEYEDRKQFYNKTKPKFDKKKRAFNKEYSNFNIKSSMANVTKNFKIILKNEKTLSARLIAVSEEYDLALLKLDKHITPYIKTNKLRVHQTMVVYAVGSPLGITDSVTSGIITGIKDDYVLTDTKILPGNSGGPLLNEEGAAIGVNTARVSEVINAEGLGIAIPIAIAYKEFAIFISEQ